jgi:glycerol-3-phosphate acyltransferase PlsY
VAGHCHNPWLSIAGRRLVGGKGFAGAAGALLAIYPWLVVAWLGIGLAAWVGFYLGRRITDEAPASVLATIGVVPCAAWLHDGRAAVVMACAAVLILPKLAREVREELGRRDNAT